MTRGSAVQGPVVGRSRTGAGGHQTWVGALALLVALVAHPGEASGQERLTLDRALEIASASNPEYRKALNDLDLVGPASRQAWGAFLPNLQIGLGTGYGFTQRRVGTDDFGNPVPNPNAQRRWNSDASQFLSANLTLFEGGRRFHAVSAARANSEANDWTAQAELARVSAEVSRQFYRAQRQEDLLEVERELLQGRTQDLDATRRLFEIAAKSQTDLLGTELELKRQERAVRAQESERQKALEALRVALGDRDVDLQSGVAASPPTIVDLSGLDVEGLIALALESHPTLRARRARERAASSSLRSARATRWPTIRLGGSLYRQAFGPETDFLFDANPDQSRYGNLSFDISIPLFQNFQTSYQIAEADVALRNAQQDMRLERLRLEQSVRDAAIDLLGASDQAQLQAEARGLADRRLELVREEYRLAVADFEALQNAVREAATARRDEVNARYDYVEALVNLEEVVGSTVPRPDAD